VELSLYPFCFVFLWSFSIEKRFPRDYYFFVLFGSAVIEIKSDTSLAEAVQILSEHKILSAPVVDVDAPEDASWIDRYIGIVEFAGIVVWILHQVS
jgi:CBS domain-containing protein